MANKFLVGNDTIRRGGEIIPRVFQDGRYSENYSRTRSPSHNITKSESRKKLNNSRAKSPGLIGKICATFRRSYQKRSGDPETCNEKSGNSESRPRSLRKSIEDDRMKTVENDKTAYISTTDNDFFVHNSFQILRLQDANTRFPHGPQDSVAMVPRSPNNKMNKKSRERPESGGKRKKRTLCQTLGCKSVKSKVEVREAATDVNVDLQELITKIKELKKNVQDLETARKNPTPKKVSPQNVSSQTEERFLTDIYGAQELLGSCNNNLSRIRKFLGSRKCQKLIEQHQSKPCCDEKIPHFHSLLDGLDVIVKFPNEKITHDKVHMTPDPTLIKHTAEQPEKHVEEKAHEVKVNEAIKPVETKKNQEPKCPDDCTTDATIEHKKSPKNPAKEKSAGTPSTKSTLKKNGDIKEKAQVTRNEKKYPDKKTGNLSSNPGSNEKTTQSREVWYGKSTFTSENEPLETFISENAPRIQPAIKRREVRLNSKPFADHTSGSSSPKTVSARD